MRPVLILMIMWALLFTGCAYHLAYYVYALYRPRTEIVDGQCKVLVAGTLISRGNPIWQKRIETPVRTRNWVADDWLGKSLGELASDTIVLALKDLAYRLVEDSQGVAQVIIPKHGVGHINISTVGCAEVPHWGSCSNLSPGADAFMPKKVVVVELGVGCCR